MFKRVLSFVLVVVLVLGVCGCGGSSDAPETTQEPTVEATYMDWTKLDSLKVLVLGHSLMVDSGHMLALIAATEGVENFTLGTLYYSGCPIYRHVEFLTNNTPAYTLYLSSTETSDQPPDQMKDVTMEQALRFQDWDVIVMMGGTFELAEEKTFTDGKIQIIQNYVNEHKFKKDAIFAWHMPWAFATEPELQAMYTAGGNPYTKGYAAFDNDRVKLYQAFAEQVKNHIIPDETFRFLVPSGTAIENAMSSYLDEFGLLRDYGHANDLGRVISSYTWYCKLFGVEELAELKFTTIPRNFFRSLQSPVNYELTEMEQKIIIESVNNALKNPLQITQSQYTEAPEA